MNSKKTHRPLSRRKSENNLHASTLSQITKQFETYERILKNGMPRLSAKVLAARIQSVNRLLSIAKLCLPEVIIACHRKAHLRRICDLREKLQDLEKKASSKSNILQALFSKNRGWMEEDLHAKQQLKAELATELATKFCDPARNDFVSSHGEPLISSQYLEEITDGLNDYLLRLKDALVTGEEMVKARDAADATKKGEKEEAARKRDQTEQERHDRQAERTRRVEERKHAKLEADAAIAARSQEKSRRRARIVRRKIYTDQFDILKICPYCASNLDPDKSHADHIYPLAHGGLSTITNMVFVCGSCNLKKRDLTLREFIARNPNLGQESIAERLTLLEKKF